MHLKEFSLVSPKIPSTEIFKAIEIAIPASTQLDDGSYLSWIYPSGKLRKKGFKPIQVRVIEYTIENYDRPEAQVRYRLITSLLNAEKLYRKELRETTQELSKNLFQNFDLNKLNTEVLES